MPADHNRATRSAILAIAILVGTIVGCGESEPALYPVTITVTYPDNKPVPGAQIVLRSTEHNTTSRGSTGDDGTCQLTTLKPNDGASPGPHQVLIAEPPHIGDPDVPRKGPQIAERFASFTSSGLEVIVKDDGSENVFPLQVTPR